MVDSAGNLIVAVGPDKDSVAFVAHTDEGSFEVDSILPDGHVTLTRKGGVIPSAWEGQPAMLVFDPDASGNTNEALRGVFVPRETARSKAPPRLLAWFGLDAAGLTGAMHCYVDITDGLVTFLTFNGDGTLGMATQFASGMGTRSVVLADLDGDRRSDVIVPQESHIVVLRASMSTDVADEI